MEIVSFVDEGLGNASYLVGVGGGRALVVDPQRDISPYLAAAAERGWRVELTAETHLHADFVSGSCELATRGARVVVPADARAAFPHRGVSDGDEVELDGVGLQVVATPGHTPEHVSYLLRSGARLVALFSGGALIVGGVARPDLLGAQQTAPLARAAYRTVVERLLTLPDDLPVYPTHGAGSFCSAGDGSERTTTIGRERRRNPLLQAPDRDAFVEQLLDGLGSYPSYFRALRETNRRGPRVYDGRWPVLSQLPPEEVRRSVAEGAELVDVRSAAAFAAGHIPGALAITLRPQFAAWLGWLVDAQRPLVFVRDAEQDPAELVSQCLRIGYERLGGELAGGMDSWSSSGGQIRHIRRLAADDVDPSWAVLDVRQEREWREGHVPGAVHVELGELPGRASTVRRDDLLVHCAHGERATTAASLLERAGHRRQRVLDGGPEDYRRATGISLAR